MPTSYDKVPLAGSDRSYDDVVSEHEQSLDALVIGAAEVSEQISLDAALGLSELEYDLLGDAQSRFEAILETVNVRLNVSIDYRKTYADEIFQNAAKEFTLHLNVNERNQLTNLRRMAREMGPDDSRVRVLTAFSYPTKSQIATASALDVEVWTYLQKTADTLGPEHPKIRSVLTTASSALAGAAMSAALDESVWRRAQDSAAELGPAHPKVRLILSAASAPQVKAAMAAALDERVWIGVQQIAEEEGVGHFSVRQMLSACSTKEIGDLMLGLLYRQTGAEPMAAAAIRFFKERRRDYIERITNEAAETDPRAEWLTRENPEMIDAVLRQIRLLRQEAMAEGRTLSDSHVYVAFYKDADYQEGQEGRADRTRPFQIVAALMGGSRTGKLPF